MLNKSDTSLNPTGRVLRWFYTVSTCCLNKHFTEPFIFIVTCENKGISKTNTQTCSHWSSIKFPTFGMKYLFMSRSVFTPVCLLSVFINCICLMDYNYYFNCILFMHTDRQRGARKAPWVLIKKKKDRERWRRWWKMCHLHLEIRYHAFKNVQYNTVTFITCQSELTQPSKGSNDRIANISRACYETAALKVGSSVNLDTSCTRQAVTLWASFMTWRTCCVCWIAVMCSYSYSICPRHLKRQ